MKGRAIAVLLATFVAGAVAGAGAHHVFRPPPPLGPFQLPERELDLTPEQRAKIDAIMQAHQPQIAEATREVFPKMKAIADEIRAQTLEVLTPHQREVLERIEREHGGPPPLMPPPRPPRP